MAIMTRVVPVTCGGLVCFFKGRGGLGVVRAEKGSDGVGSAGEDNRGNGRR